VSILFQFFTIASHWIEIYWPFIIIFTSLSLLPLVQFIYRRKYNRNAEKWSYFLSDQYKNVGSIVLALGYLRPVVNPYMWIYLIIQSVYAILSLVIFEFPEILTIIDFMIKRYWLSLQRWHDEINGRLMPNS
jgi:hypothetical protein